MIQAQTPSSYYQHLIFYNIVKCWISFPSNISVLDCQKRFIYLDKLHGAQPHTFTDRYGSYEVIAWPIIQFNKTGASTQTLFVLSAAQERLSAAHKGRNAAIGSRRRSLTLRGAGVATGMRRGEKRVFIHKQQYEALEPSICRDPTWKTTTYNDRLITHTVWVSYLLTNLD